MKTKTFKVMILGDSGVGKTSMLEQYVSKSFSGHYKVTIGSDFLSKDLTLDGEKVKLQIWDTAGQEKYRSLSVAYYRGADACIFVYDVTDKASFNNLGSWLEAFFSQVPGKRTENFPILLVGNKIDKKERTITEAAAKKWCKEHGDIGHYETSAKTRAGLDDTFDKIATLVLEQHKFGMYLLISLYL